MQTTTTQDGFHPMFGHVNKGTTVRMRDGAVLTLQPDGIGSWSLQREDGSTYSDRLSSAYAVLDAIVNY